MMWAAIFGFIELMVSPGKDPSLVLALADISIDSRENPKLVQLHLRHSKTDQFGEGVTISNDSDLCPVAAVLAYIAVRPPTAGPLLRCCAEAPESTGLCGL